MTKLLACQKCGSVVSDKDKHNEWHNYVVKDLTPIEEIDLTVRMYNVLRRHGFAYLEQLIGDRYDNWPGKSYESWVQYFWDFRNVGRKTAEDTAHSIEEYLKTHPPYIELEF